VKPPFIHYLGVQKLRRGDASHRPRAADAEPGRGKAGHPEKRVAFFGDPTRPYGSESRRFLRAGLKPAPTRSPTRRRQTGSELDFIRWNMQAIGIDQIRRSAMGAIAILSLMLAMTPARAEGSWCARYGGGSGGTNCGFYSFDQCMAAISGNGGFCRQNGFYGQQSYPRTRTRR
jgi:Protein of unknown function (DUF3551)